MTGHRGCQAETKGSVERETAANLTAEKTCMSSSSCGGLEGKRETEKHRLELKETEIELNRRHFEQGQVQRDRNVKEGSKQMNNCLMSSV